MRMDKLTHSLQAALGDAQSLAVGRDHPYIEPIHVLKAMLDPAAFRPGCCAPPAPSWNRCRPQIKPCRVLRPSRARLMYISQDTATVESADKLSQQAGDAYLSTDSVLLAMLESKTTGSLLKDGANH